MNKRNFFLNSSQLNCSSHYHSLLQELKPKQLQNGIASLLVAVIYSCIVQMCIYYIQQQKNLFSTCAFSVPSPYTSNSDLTEYGYSSVL